MGESVAYPFRYFDNNLVGSITLYMTMAKYNCKKVIMKLIVFRISPIFTPSFRIGSMGLNPGESTLELIKKSVLAQLFVIIL